MGIANRILALLVACSSVAAATPNVPREHVVQRGQTLARIAKRYHIDLDSLCAANDLKKSGKLQPGLRLTIPSDDDRGESTAQKPVVATNGESRFATPAAKKPETERRVATRAISYGQYLARPARRGWVHVMGHHGEWQGQLLSKHGKLQPKAAAALSRLLAWPRTDFSMDRGLLILLAQISDSFGGRTLRVVSGYRATSYSSESKHPLGRACDFHLLGVPNNALRDFVRTFDNVGIGYYPNSTFIHLDVRDQDAYWVDYAGHGEPPRSTPYRVARQSDESPMTGTRAAAFMKSSDAETANPEAEADMQSRQQEHRDGKSDTLPAPDTSRPNRFGITSPQRDIPRANVTGEPEAAKDVQPDATAPEIGL